MIVINNRLDKELVARKIFQTRAKAVTAINSGIVSCNNIIITKPSMLIDKNTEIKIVGNIMPYVSRGGLKLEKALKTFAIDLGNKIMLDIGSSTGGFTDCALQNNVKKVIAVDVGSNQMDSKLREDNRVSLYEKTDFRDFDINLLKEVDIVTIDVSFISVIKIMNKLKEIESLKEIICLIKPQFEVGKEIASKYKGVILKPDIHKEVIQNIINAFFEAGFFCSGITYSPITGGDGNMEYLLYLKKNNLNLKFNINNIVNEAFNSIPR